MIFLWAALLAILPTSAHSREVEYVHHRLTVGPALSILGISSAQYGFGPSLGYVYRPGPDSQIYAGGETGYIRWNETFTTAIPVLAHATYVFKPKSDSAKFYLGIGAGVAPTWVEGLFSINTQFMFRPGLEFKYFYFEPKVGLFNLKFIMIPTIGLYLDLV